MAKFFKKNTEGLLAMIAVILIVALAACVVWGMIYLSGHIGDLFVTNSAVNKTSNFNLSGAGRLNLRGLVPQPSAE